MGNHFFLDDMKKNNSGREEAEGRLSQDKEGRRRKKKETKSNNIIQGVEDEGFYKEAFDNFDWNKSGSISTKVTYLIILIGTRAVVFLLR